MTVVVEGMDGRRVLPAIEKLTITLHTIRSFDPVDLFELELQKVG